MTRAQPTQRTRGPSVALHVLLMVTWFGLAIWAAFKGTEPWAILALAFAAGMHFGRLIEER